MSRRVAIGVLFAQAPAVRAVAPTAALAMARGGGSGSAFSVCRTHGGAIADDRDPSSGNRPGEHCCLSRACCRGVAPLLARPDLVGAAPVQRIAFAWTVADRAAPTSLLGPFRARAPPLLA